MDGTKSALTSLGIMGPLIGGIAYVLNNFVFKAEVITAEDGPNLVNAGIALWTVFTAIWGRYRASKKVTLTGR